MRLTVSYCLALSYHSGETVLLVKPGDVEHKHKFELYAHGLSLSKYTNIDLTDSIDVKYDINKIISIQQIKTFKLNTIIQHNTIKWYQNDKTHIRVSELQSDTYTITLYNDTDRIIEARVAKFDLTDSINIKYDDDTIISIESIESDKPNMFPPASNKNSISIKSSFATPAKKTAAGSGTNAVRYLKTNKKNQTRLPKI